MTTDELVQIYIDEMKEIFFLVKFLIIEVD